VAGNINFATRPILAQKFSFGAQQPAHDAYGGKCRQPAAVFCADFRAVPRGVGLRPAIDHPLRACLSFDDRDETDPERIHRPDQAAQAMAWT